MDTHFPLDMTMNKLAKLSPTELKYYKRIGKFEGVN